MNLLASFSESYGSCGLKSHHWSDSYGFWVDFTFVLVTFIMDIKIEELLKILPWWIILSLKAILISKSLLRDRAKILLQILPF